MEGTVPFWAFKLSYLYHNNYVKGSIVVLFSKKTLFSKICQDLGARFRTTTIDEQLKHSYHKESVRALQVSKVSKSKVAKCISMIMKSK